MINNDKIILGLNGWSQRGHDASATLLVGNKIVAFVEEERFTRKRYSYDSLPVNAIAYCLKKAKITIDDLDRVVFGWDMPTVYKVRGQKFPYSNQELINLLFPRNLYYFKKTPKIEYFNHHLSHISSALWVSGFKKTNILVLDGQGESESGTIAYFDGKKIKILSKIEISSSLGYMMEAACKYIGLRTSDAGKLMGLAGHGKTANVFSNLIINGLNYRFNNFPNDNKIISDSLDEQNVVIENWIKFFSKHFPLKVNKISRFDQIRGIVVSELKFTQKHKNFAFSVQKTLETVIVHLVKELVKKTNNRNLIITGGIGLNCSTNGKLISERVVDNLYIMPATNDAGVSLGAALEVATKDYGYKFNKLERSYFGCSYSDSEIGEELKRHKLRFKKYQNIYKVAARAISDGKIVAWFQGDMEVGPRALGNRSIIANPSIESMHQKVNEIKSRENWRPLAPSILEEYRDQLFENSSYSPFMLQNHKVKKNWYKKIPAVVHTDRTSRYQSVTKYTNHKYYKLIKEFHRITGLPIVLNTSFNIGGEPLVCTPDQAIKTFYASAIDCLAIGNYWLEKNEK